MLDASPFPHQGPLRPDLGHSLFVREPLVTDLVERVTARRVTALLGPRRFGKTSVLRFVADALTAAGTSVVWVDLYGVQSAADVAAVIDQAAARVEGRFRRHARAVASTFTINLGAVRASFTRPGAKPDADATLAAVLDVVVGAALETPTVLIIDEFSELAAIDGAAGKLRAALQHHYDDIGLLFAGSAPSTMEMMFADRAQPFYAQADRITIGPLGPADVAAIVDDGFETTGRDPGPLGGLVHELAGGHPQRTMQLADAAWRRSEPGGRWDDTIWLDALDEVRRSEDEPARRIWDRTPRSERSVLRLLANERPLYGTDAELLGLASASARNAHRKLLDRGTVTAADHGPDRITDPLYGDWIRRQFPH